MPLFDTLVVVFLNRSAPFRDGNMFGCGAPHNREGLFSLRERSVNSRRKRIDLQHRQISQVVCRFGFGAYPFVVGWVVKPEHASAILAEEPFGG